MTSEASVAIALVTVGPRPMLAAALESMQPDAEAGIAEVWVVDNGSPDDCAAMVRSRFPWAEVVEPGENLGYGRAVNLVAERTHAAWIAPANDDIELEATTLKKLLEAGLRHADAGIVAPRLVLPDGATQHSVRPFPTLGFTLAFNAGIYKLLPRAAERQCLDGAWDPTRARQVPWAMATFYLVRRQAFQDVNGFSARQFMHAEDLDIGWRLRESGWQTWFEPSARVLHHGSVSTTRAYGDALRVRWMTATYSWIARTWGVPKARSIALANLAGSTLRWGALKVAALVFPRRFGARRDEVRTWIQAHRTGLAARSELLREH